MNACSAVDSVSDGKIFFLTFCLFCDSMQVVYKKTSTKLSTEVMMKLNKAQQH